MANERKIAKAASIMGFATIISRIMGYLRDACIAYIFGATMYADAFFVAFRVSNLLRRLVGEGALTSSFIPIFTDVFAGRSKEEARDFVSGFFTLFFIILVVLAVLGMVFSRNLVVLMSPGFLAVERKFSITVNLTRLMFPHMVFIGLMAASMGVLHTMRHFAAPALSPVVFNISIILFAFLLSPFLGVPVYALGIGVVCGVALQFAVQVPFLKRYGMLPRIYFRWNDPAIKKILILMGPAVVGIGIYQLNVFVTTNFASRLPEGSVSYLYFGSRLMELPLGIFGVAFTHALLPSLSEFVTKKDFSSFRDSLSFTMRTVNFVNIPATAGLIVLAPPIINILFRRGEFGPLEASQTAFALYFYALGIVPVASSRILVSVFYSLKDTRTPVIGAVMSFFFNIIMCIVLIKPLRHGGLALAASLSAVLDLSFLSIALRLKMGRFGARGIVFSALKSFAAAVLMGATLFLLTSYSGWEGFGKLHGALFLGFSIAAGLIVYITVCRFLNAHEVVFLKEIVEGRIKRIRTKYSSN
ncbi:MAG: murein biosynthesis integral membrane protein MurJ [Deltaproteobacteria bacterium]|nr:murein biosynthesis integral membrane protein MurJ [Deltaproteobacteria bacterium]